MANGPITSWQIDGEKVETVTDLIFLGWKIIVDSDCSHKVKRCLILGRKSMTNLESMLKSRDICTTYNLMSLSFSFHAVHRVRPLHHGLIVNVFERHSHSLSGCKLVVLLGPRINYPRIKSKEFLTQSSSLFMVHGLNKAEWSLNADKIHLLSTDKIHFLTITPG